MRPLFSLFAAACFGLSGCAGTSLYRSLPEIESGSHPLTKPYVPEVQNDGLFHLSCTDKYPDGASHYKAFDADQSPHGRVDLAKRHFIHAAMASNVYRKPRENPLFNLPGWTLLERQESTSGLSLDLYGNTSSLAESTKLVIAFRGTDFDSLLDWKANFSLTKPQQFEQAIEYYRSIRRSSPTAEIVVTGHSLGGAIALNISLREPAVSAVAFNSSPRAFFGSLPKPPNYRVQIYEVGEVLDAITGWYLRLRLPDDTRYGNYNFLDYKLRTVSPIPEHGIYELARSLLLVSMMRGDEYAREVFVKNIPIELARSVSWDACKPLYRQM